jgi:hypothetical protein
MSRASGPRRAAASAGIAVALAAGAAGGLVAADLERTSVAAGATVAAEVALAPQPSPLAGLEAVPSLTPAPAPQNPRAGQAPHTTTRAS